MWHMSELRLGRLHLRLGRFARVVVIVVFFSVSTIFKLSFPVQAEKGDEDEDADGCGCGVEDAANDGDDSVVIHRQSFLLPVFVS